MSIPDWYEDNFYDVEQIMVDLFTKVFGPEMIGVWEPDDWTDEANPEPLTTFIRLPGGHVSWDEGYDECFIQATVFTLDRNESIKRMGVIRSILLPMSGTKVKMADGNTAQIRETEEIAGPQMLTADQAIDTRVIPATFRVCVGLKSRKTYERIIRDL